MLRNYQVGKGFDGASDQKVLQDMLLPYHMKTWLLFIRYPLKMGNIMFIFAVIFSIYMPFR